MKYILAMATILTAAACGSVDPAEMEARQFEKMNLDARQREVAGALVEGYRKETGRDLLRSSDYGRAGCYALKVEMPSRFHSAHVAYLKDYTEIEKTYYEWFARRGVGEDDAWTIGQKVTETLDQCSAGALVKELISKRRSQSE